MSATIKQIEILEQVQTIFTNLINSEEFTSTNNLSMIDGYVNTMDIDAGSKEQITLALYSVYATVREL